MDLCLEIALLKQESQRSLSPEGIAAAERLLKFLDGVVRDNPDGALPRGYTLEPMGLQGTEGIAFPLMWDTDVECEQYAIFAKDIATGWLEELCAFVDEQRVEKIRNACGV